LAQLLLLRGAKQLLTLRGPSGVRRGAALNDLGIIEDGSVLIQDGRIVSVGATRRIENLKEAKGAIDVPVTGAVVMPGYVDPAVHVSLYESGASAESVAKRKKSLNFYQESLTLIRSCLQHGTLSAQFKLYSESASPTADIAALRQLSDIGANPVSTVRSLRLPSSIFDETKFAAFAVQLAKLHRKKLVHFLELAADPNLPASNLFWDFLSRTGFPINLIWPGGSAAQLQALLTQARPRCVFCPVELNNAECAVLGHSPCISVFSPCKDLLEERENPSAKKLVAAGGAIALASGYDAKDAPIFSMQMVVALAVLRLRLTVEQAIVATTVNAAYALGCADDAGTLEAGKRADILVLNLSDYREIPRRIGVNQVVMALRDGNFVINRKRAQAKA
jgi:imidazolonepropionase